MDRRLVATAAALWLGAGVLAYLVVSATTVPLVDMRIATAAHDLTVANPWLASMAAFFAVMGSAPVLTPLTVAVVVLLARGGHVWWAAWVGACGLGGVLVSESVKYTVDRVRPVWPDPFVVLSSPSFPSGHSMAGIYGYVVFGVVAWHLLARRWPAVVLIAFGVLMGPSRVLLGVHWPTDVLAGWLLAAAWCCTAGVIVRRVRAVRGSPPASTRPPADTPR